MKLFLAKRDDQSSGMATMVLMCSTTQRKCEYLMHAFNEDRAIRDGGGCPIEMDPRDNDWEWYCVGDSFEAETEPRIMHYQYQH